VLAVFPTANLIHRQILNGVLRYAHRHGPWEIHLQTDLDGEQGLAQPRAWHCAGIIALVASRAEANAVLAARVPTVFFNPPPTLLGPRSPLARSCLALRDQAALGRAGAEYFLDRQYAHFAFLGDVNNAAWSEERARGFAERVADAGFACLRYPASSRRERSDFGREQKRLRVWLLRLPKPTALMVAWDRRARQVLDTCLAAGIAVPHEIAVLGVDNDEVLCETASPSLSSIAMDGESNGYEIAKLLDRRMRNPAAHRACMLSFGLSHVVSRRSTDTTCIADPLMARALAFVHANPTAHASVTDVARHLNISQRLLELRARASFGRPLRDEIQRVRFEHVRSLLRNTELTVGEIAAACGFYDPSHLCLRFRRMFRLTPAAFRASFRRETV
jgi:LacI family transcriptional regulator